MTTSGRIASDAKRSAGDLVSDLPDVPVAGPPGAIGGKAARERMA